jgi:hypothetical protein
MQEEVAYCTMLLSFKVYSTNLAEVQGKAYIYCGVPKSRGIHNQRLRKTKRYPQTR